MCSSTRRRGISTLPGGSSYAVAETLGWKSGLFRKLLRVVAIRQFRLDYYASFIRNTQNRKAWVLGTYGSPHATPLLRGYYPPYGRPQDIQLAYASRSEILSRVEGELTHSDPLEHESHRPIFPTRAGQSAENTHAL